jgi:biopolymer transport protein ExbB
LDAQTVLTLLQQGGLTVYPLTLGSILCLAILIERLWRFRGIDRGTRKLTRDTIECLVRRDLAGARSLCEKAKTPISEIYLEAMRWKNVALRGIWIVGTVGSLAPYVGLFGTVVGIIRAFHDMAVHGAGGFEIVAAGISEALIATAAGLAVAIVALLMYNYLQTRVGQIAATYARSCERFVQALLYVESATGAPGGGTPEVSSGRLVPA